MAKPLAEAFAAAHQVLLLRHPATGTPLEVSLAWLPFEREAIDHATTPMSNGCSCYTVARWMSVASRRASSHAS